MKLAMTRVGRFRALVVAALMLLVIVGVLSATFDFEEIFAALLGVTPIMLLLLWQEYVNVPELDFIYDPTEPEFHPELDASWVLADGQPQGITQWLRIGVRNNGRATARRCRPELFVERWHEGRAPSAPAAERKSLKWSAAGLHFIQEGLGAAVDIYPGATEHIDVLVNPLRVPHVTRTAYGEGEASHGPLAAWAATPFAYFGLGVFGRLQDGFSVGDFQIRLRVMGDNLNAPITSRWSLRLARQDETNRTQFRLTRIVR